MTEDELDEIENDEKVVEQLVALAATGDAEAGNQLLQLYRQRLRSLLSIRMDPWLTARPDPSDVVDTRLPSHINDCLTSSESRSVKAAWAL